MKLSKFIAVLTLACTTNVFALSLGDMVNANTAKAQTTTTSTMTMTAQKSDHTEYTIKNATGTTVALVNKQGSVYAEKWSDTDPNLDDMLGTYKPEFDAAYAKRPKGDLRRLIIDTPNIAVEQFGLPGGQMQGFMIAKDLQPQ